MSQAQLIRDAGEYVVWFTFMASVLFPPVTALFWPWWKSPWGWNIITLEMGISVALVFAWLHYAFGITITRSYAATWAQIAAIAFVGCVIIWRAILIWRTQRKGGQDGNSPPGR